MNGVTVAIVGMIFALFAQTGAIVWWASRTNTLVQLHDEDLRLLKHAVAERSSDASSSEAGRRILRDIEALEGRITKLETT